MQFYRLLAGLVTTSGVLLLGLGLHAQDVIAPGSTIEGEKLRAEGVYLQGRAWYELNKARADELYVKTMIAWNKEYSRQYQDEQKRLAEADARREARRTKKKQDTTKFLKDREERLRTKPTPEDIQSGNALNALLSDLSDAGLTDSAMRAAQIPLPDDLTIRSLIFRFAPRPGRKGSDTLSNAFIAIGRLDMKGRWPTPLKENAVASERLAYESAFGRVVKQSEAKALDLPTAIGVVKAIEALRDKASKSIGSELGFRAAAVRHLGEMKQATSMFHADTIDYTQEMIADTQKHEAHTVGELLAFMQKYRLLFYNASNSPGAAESYHRIYDLLRQQKESLGLKPLPEWLLASPVEPVMRDTFQTGSRWVCDKPQMTWEVLQRQGETFVARVGVNSSIVRTVRGTIAGGNIRWNARDVVAQKGKGGQGHDNYGTISGDTIAMEWSLPGDPRSGRYEMRREVTEGQASRAGGRVPPAPGRGKVAGPGRPIFNGKGYEGWISFSGGRIIDPGAVFDIKQRELVHDETKRSGYLRTDKAFQNFELSLDYFVMDDGSGPGHAGGVILIPENGGGQHIYGLDCEIKPDHPGYLYVRGLENKGADWGVIFTPASLGPQKKLAGQHRKTWNHLTIRCDESKITYLRNGSLINHALRDGSTSLFIALRGQKMSIKYSNIMLRPL